MEENKFNNMSDLQNSNTNNTQNNQMIAMPNNFKGSSNDKKKKNSVAIVTGLVIFGLAIAIIVFLLLRENNKKDTDKNYKKNTNNEVKEIIWNGVYENEHGYISLYQLNDEELSYSMIIDGASISGTAEINKNIAEGEIFDTYTFILNGDTVELSSTNKDITKATYKKTKEYTKTDYFKDNYGDPEYLNTDINGIFERDSIAIKIYQTSDDRAYITIVRNNSIYAKGIDIVNNELILNEESFGDVDKINATIENDQLIISASSTDTESILNQISGTYDKSSSYTMDDIIDKCF